MSHPDRNSGTRRGRLTLRERRALRRGDKVYRNGISVDRNGRPVAGDLDEQGRDRSQWGISGSNIDRHGNPIDPSSPDYVPNFDDNDDPGIGSDGFGDDNLGNVVGGGDDEPPGTIITGGSVNYGDPNEGETFGSGSEVITHGTDEAGNATEETITTDNDGNVTRTFRTVDKDGNTIPNYSPTILTDSSALHGEEGHVHQSGDDWGTEDLDDYFGNDLADMDPTTTTTTTTATDVGTQTGGTGDTPNPFGSNTTLGDNPTIITTVTDQPNQELAEGILADTDAGPPKLPEETDDPNISSDDTDSGGQTTTDPEDEEEDATIITTPTDDSPLETSIADGDVDDGLIPQTRKEYLKKYGLQGAGGVRIGGRVGRQSRREMVTGSRTASILDPNPYT